MDTVESGIIAIYCGGKILRPHSSQVSIIILWKDIQIYKDERKVVGFSHENMLRSWPPVFTMQAESPAVSESKMFTFLKSSGFDFLDLRQ